MAQAARNTPAYTTLGLDDEMHMLNPTTMTRRKPMMNGLLLPTRSEKKAATTAKIAAVM